MRAPHRDAEPADEAFMRRALALAENGLGLASPNPMVGAVVVSDGEVIGEGWHEGPGTAHAEVMALGQAGGRARGGTLYVSLEPCSHHGRTPPCAQAIARAGVARVVAAIRDPYPLVDGRGLEALRRQGIRVDEGLLAAEAGRLIEGFAKHVRTGLPMVTVKMAASLDGKVAARDGTSRWLTGEEAREDAHRLRAASDAVLVGAGTVLADHPSLTVRIPGYRGRQPMRVVADGRGRVSPKGSPFDPQAPTVLATTAAAPPSVRASWAAAGAEVVVLDDPTGSGRVSVAALVELLGKRDMQNVLIEGGPTLAWSAIEERVVDRVVWYVSPKLVGGADAPGGLGGDGVASIGEAVELSIESVERIGQDLKVVGRVHGNR